MRAATLFLHSKHPSRLAFSSLHEGKGFARRRAIYSTTKPSVYHPHTTLQLYEDITTHLCLKDGPGNAALVGLVSEGKYGAAEHLRLQLLKDGVEIKPHAIYEKAAVAALQWYDQEKSLLDFSFWFSLVPDIDEAKPATALGPFRDVRNALLRSGSPAHRLSIVFRFGIMCASKGYLEPMFQEILQLVVRYATATEGAQFLLNIEKAATQYQLDRHPENAKATTRQYRALAVEICCQVGWLNVATKVARLKRDFTLPDRTYDFFLQYLQGQKSSKLRMIVHSLRSHDALHGSNISLKQQRWKFALFPNNSQQDFVYPAVPSPPSLSPVPQEVPGQEVSRGSVALQVKALKRALKTGRMPERRELIQFLTNYKHMDGSHRLLTLLRNKALVYDAISWLTTELMFHDWEREHHQVILLFTAYFTRTLPPLFDYTLSRLLAPTHHRRVDAKLGLVRLDRHNRWVVSRAIISLSPTLPWPLATVQSLYTSYLKEGFFKGSGRVFTAFIWAFGKCGSLDEARQVLRDMEAVGRMPDGRHFDALAGAYARAGNVDRAMDLLDKIEQGVKDPEGILDAELKGDEVGASSPRLSTYGRIMQGFIDAKLLEPALVVQKRLEQKLPYRRGVNQKLDAVVDSLRALQIEQALE